DEHKSKHAPKRNCCADGYHDHPGDLWRSNAGWPNNARPGQEPRGQINQHEANKKRSVSNCTNQDKHTYYFHGKHPESRRENGANGMSDMAATRIWAIRTKRL